MGPIRNGRAFHVIIGPRGISRWALEALCPLLETLIRVYWVDAANRFDVRALALAARRGGLDPRVVLSRIHLSRAFNAFQLTALLGEKLPRLPSAPIILADPLDSFYDADLPLEDARNVFSRFSRGIADATGPVLALLEDRRGPPGRGDFSPRLAEQAASVVRLSAREGGSDVDHAHRACVESFPL